VHARDQARAVLRHYRDFLASAPEELTAYAGLLSTREGKPAVGVIACYCGDLVEGERVLKPLRTFGSPLQDAIQPMPFPAIQKLLDDAFPNGTYNYWKSTFVRELSDEVIELIFEHANQAKSPLSAIVVEFYGGAAGRVDEAATAFAQRQAEYDIGIMGAVDAAENDRHIAWVRSQSTTTDRPRPTWGASNRGQH
jgi:hypothetical protein